MGTARSPWRRPRSTTARPGWAWPASAKASRYVKPASRRRSWCWVSPRLAGTRCGAARTPRLPLRFRGGASVLARRARAGSPGPCAHQGRHRDGPAGPLPHEAAAFVRSVGQLPGLVVEGIFTHLAVADGTSEWEEAYTAGQLAAFRGVLDELAPAGIRIPLIHALNSAGLLRQHVPVEGIRSILSGAPPERDGAQSKDAIARDGRSAPSTPWPEQHGHSAQDAPLRPSDSVQWPKGDDAAQDTSTALTGNLVRAGIAVYGLDPSPQVRCPPDFRPRWPGRRRSRR